MSANKKSISALTKQMQMMSVQLAALSKRPAPAPKPKRKRNRKSKAGGSTKMGGGNVSGSVTVSRSELLTDLTVAAKKDEVGKAIKLIPSTTVLTWLNGLSKAFDQIVWHSVSIEYRPAVGAMKDGSLVVGIDWNPAASSGDRGKVQACTPNFETPVWKGQRLTVPSSGLMSRKSYILLDSNASNSAPCAILANLRTSNLDNATFYGDLWVSYKVTLMGPSS